MRKTIVLCFLLACTAIIALAQGTRTWEQSRYDDFEKGTPKGVAIRSDGTLELAPAIKPIATTASTFLWAMAVDREGNIFAAAGSPARVYRITPTGQISIVLEPQELQVQALVADVNKGVVYAATSPDGRVYRIERKAGATPASRKTQEKQQDTKPAAPQAPSPNEPAKAVADPNYTSTVYFEPKTKYIWSLALDPAGNLYLGTGDRGEIYKVTAQNQGTIFLKSDEVHIRALAFDSVGNLIAGSDGSGLIYRISPRGDAFVLYSAPKKEITALAVDANNNIFAAGVGIKRAAAPQPAPTPPSPQAESPSAPQQQQGPAAAMTAGAAVGGSEIYQIAADGSPQRLWSSRDDIVYALGFDNTGQLIAGTGNRGRIFAIFPDGEYSDLLKAAAAQITSFARAPQGGLYLATSNLGKVLLMSSAPETEGSYTSDVFDARIFSRWGRAEVRGQGGYQLLARSGNVDNPDRNWSPWKQVALDRDAPLDVPSARFVQWKAVLVSGNPAPRIESVLLNYLPKNVSPRVDEVGVTVGTRYSAQPRMISELQQPPPQAAPVKDRDWIALRWDAHDDNDDRLSYNIYYRGDREQRWKQIKERVADRFYAFEAALLPDGGYNIRIVATDAPSHTPDQALTSEKQSARFEVDNTPPLIADLAGAVDPASGVMRVTFRASDNFSTITRAEYAVDAGEWQLIEPIGQISDSRTENYDFSLPSYNPQDANAPKLAARKSTRGQETAGDGDLAQAPEHVVVVRVWDRFDNMATAKTIVAPDRVQKPQERRK